MKYNPKIPSVQDMAIKAKKRIPGFAWDYLQSGIGYENCINRNRHDLQSINLCPRYLKDVEKIDTKNAIFNYQYDLGIGVAPVGLGGMMWPKAELSLASAAQKANIPYILSTMSTVPLEDIARIAPDVAWYQLYVPRNREIMQDLISRVEVAGYNALVVTVDIPIGAKRDRELKNGLILPFKLTPKLILQALSRPSWTIKTLYSGFPEFVNLKPYGNTDKIKHLSEFLSQFFMAGVTKERIKEIRKIWKGKLIIKGILNLDDLQDCIDLGVDGVILSNHGGRQLDSAPSAIGVLQDIKDDVHEKIVIMIDGGVRNGLDVITAKALGSKATFSGRSFMYAVAATGHDGARQVIEIFRDEITRTLQQLGCNEFQSLDRSWLCH